MSTVTKTLPALAEEAYGWFESFTREGDDETLYRLKAGRPEWLYDLVYAAHSHGDYLPDDWRYDVIHSAVGRLSDLSEDDDPDEELSEFADSQVDTYTAKRFAWLASDLRRQYYVDDAAREFGVIIDDEHGIVDMVGLGQYAEAEEVFRSVLQSLLTRLNDEDDA
jgi:hypothetical protein